MTRRLCASALLSVSLSLIAPNTALASRIYSFEFEDFVDPALLGVEMNQCDAFGQSDAETGVKVRECQADEGGDRFFSIGGYSGRMFDAQAGNQFVGTDLDFVHLDSNFYFGDRQFSVAYSQLFNSRSGSWDRQVLNFGYGRYTRREFVKNEQQSQRTSEVLERMQMGLSLDQVDGNLASYEVSFNMDFKCDSATERLYFCYAASSSRGKLGLSYRNHTDAPNTTRIHYDYGVWARSFGKWGRFSSSFDFGYERSNHQWRWSPFRLDLTYSVGLRFLDSKLYAHTAYAYKKDDPNQVKNNNVEFSLFLYVPLKSFFY